MKILLVLSHGLYLRNFRSTIIELADRGHEIVLAYSAARDGDVAMTQRVFGGDRRVRLVAGPSRTGWWWQALDPIRAIRDFVHYLDPAFAEAPKLHERVARRVPSPVRRSLAFLGRGRRGRRRLERWLELVEHAIPPDDGASRWLGEERPDIVLVSPLIDLDYSQTDVLKAARVQGRQTGLLVASWDNLTSKGRIQIQPDIVTVWNEIQRREAIDLHSVPEERVVATGAQLYDDWFAMSPSCDRAVYCQPLGRSPSEALVLYAGSSPFICPNERPVFEAWLAALRASRDGRVARAGIVLRPHPLNAAQWLDAAYDGVTIWPRAGEMPINPDQKQDYFDALWHAEAIVGVNTSSFIEAGILGRQIFSFGMAGVEETQRGTLHYRYLVDSGLLNFSDSLDDHVSQLARSLSGPVAMEDDARRFVAEFVRPAGLDVAATPRLAASIEGLAAAPRPLPPLRPRLGLAVRMILGPVAAAYLRPRYAAALSKREAGRQDRAAPR